MPLRNHDGGYGLVTKSLHGLTVVAITTQFVVGYVMDDGGGQGRGRGRGRGGESGGDAVAEATTISSWAWALGTTC